MGGGFNENGNELRKLRDGFGLDVLDPTSRKVVKKLPLFKFPTLLNPCWQFVKQCLPSMKDFDKSSPIGGLGTLIDRFGLAAKIEASVKGASLPIPEPMASIPGAKQVLDSVLGPEILYRLNVKPILEDKKKLSTKLGLDRKWCMFAPGMIPFLPRVEGSKFGPNVVLPQIPSLPRVIHTGMGDFKIVKKGVLIPDLSKFNFGVE